MRTAAPRLLALLFLAGCAGSPGPAPAGGGPAPGDSAAARQDSSEAAGTDEEEAGVCKRHGTVTVYVVNNSSMDVQIAFGPYRPQRPSLGFTRSTYKVPRPYLENYNIGLSILHGGLQTGGPASIPTEFVVCNDATLIIGARPRYSFFYGDKFLFPTPSENGEPADTTSTEPEG